MKTFCSVIFLFTLNWSYCELCEVMIGNETFYCDATRIQDYDFQSVVGTLPSEIGKLSRLKSIYLTNAVCRLSGTIPTQIGKLTTLQDLTLDCMFSGNIPSEVLNLPSLSPFVLADKVTLPSNQYQKPICGRLTSCYNSWITFDQCAKCRAAISQTPAISVSSTELSSNTKTPSETSTLTPSSTPTQEQINPHISVGLTAGIIIGGFVFTIAGGFCCYKKRVFSYQKLNLKTLLLPENPVVIGQRAPEMGIEASEAQPIPLTNTPIAVPRYHCQTHNSEKHTFFISYRKKQDFGSAEKLFLALDGKNSHTVFWDNRCLPPGKIWLDSFTEAILFSDVILLLISDKGIEDIKNAHQKPDNVLLEYELALDQFRNGRTKIIPLLLGKNQQEFKGFDVQFPDKFPCHPRSSKSATIRKIMNDLFQIHGIKVQSETLCSEVNIRTITQTLEEHRP